LNLAKHDVAAINTEGKVKVGNGFAPEKAFPKHLDETQAAFEFDSN